MQRRTIAVTGDITIELPLAPRDIIQQPVVRTDSCPHSAPERPHVSNQMRSIIVECDYDMNATLQGQERCVRYTTHQLGTPLTEL